MRAIDGLSRLVHEEREDDAQTGAVEYEFTYVYDKLGNRMRMIDHAKNFTTVYHYDVHEPAQGQDPDPFASHNNRLQWYDVYAGEFGCEDGDPFDCDAPTGSPLERVMYVYNNAGDPDVIAHYRPNSSDTVFLARFSYDTGGRVFNVEQWTYQLEGTAPDYEIVEDSEQRVGFREFRYDGGGRARYLVRVREPDHESQDVGQVISAFWTDYDGETPYADYVVESSSAVEKIAYLAGISQTVLADALGQGNPEDNTTVYFHADQVGTSRALSDGGTAIASPAAPVARRVYSAFGEPVFESAGEDYAVSRYGYVGAHGYEEGLLGPWGQQFNTYGDPDEAGTAPRLNYMHVGARWYDPSTGRFLQRDPIGIVGGLNTYTYAENSPIDSVDPTGLSTSADRALLQAMARGRVKDVRELLEATGDCLSPHVRTQVNNWVRKMTTRAGDWIAQTRKGGIWREFPGGQDGKWAKMALEEMKRDGSREGKKAWKLLNDKRWEKPTGGGMGVVGGSNIVE